jgi:hypothetical protein
MNDAPRLPRRIEVYALTCWWCGHVLDLPVSAPYQCPCGAGLVIE